MPAVVDETAAVGLNLGVQGGLTGVGPKPTFSPDTFNHETQAAHAQHLREVISRDKDHPSVVMWSIANEPASNEDGAREFFEPLVRLARELDPTRPLTYAAVMFATSTNDKIADLCTKRTSTTPLARTHHRWQIPGQDCHRHGRRFGYRARPYLQDCQGRVIAVDIAAARA